MEKNLKRTIYFIYITDTPQNSEISSPPDDGNINFLDSVVAAGILLFFKW
jgi:hypothetical protein